LIDGVEAAIRRAGTAIESATVMIELADPVGWRSPAASAYQSWAGDLAWRCRVATDRAEESADLVRHYAATIVLERCRP
jgi:hypothetical protein